MNEKSILALIRHINDEIGRVQDALVQGHATDYPTYQRLVGYASAMQNVKDFFNSLSEDE